ncbi:MAG: undecaprenyl/decaprenyl-phosphate alpha-N-acetylglucosaminyl 1-phosphate transferase [Alphaproteobacteria bacterium]|nr:undecaprenyl/decaprenyl-phosphate alpha-N-acetylglucosaminyl 1-phosphate transferase [Alphaproteobacteria bacterium]MBT4544919.1 undecaprenyl/decaprenyl-phosphate alpha-N-acetylglucosaminyl 1-phosphate transferase [Alphaproteobacteria bacterium]MBT5159341.1 undecaprenyl/decaprenyl-phosphate alpha-N-acetylglucosaminyl 1-phosphate transferase [Alphaproteobacteria bacterium]
MIWLLIISGLVSLAVCFMGDTIGRLLGVMDSPDGERKLHSHATPLVGGLAVMLPVVLSSLFLANITVFTLFYLSFAAATAAVMLLGLIDDRNHIRPYIRLAISVVIGYGVILVVPDINVTFLSFTFLDSPLFLNGIWALIFTLLCLVGLQNAINMADGQNGLVMGMTLIWVVCLSAYAPTHLLPLLGVFAIGLAIALIFNLNGRLFLGDSGSYAISISMGILAIYVYAVGFDRLPADIVAIWFLVPVMDCLRLMVMRMVRGRSPFSSDRHHLHHMLQGLMSTRRALMCYLGLVAGPAVLAWAAPAFTLWWGVMTFVIYTIILAVQKQKRAMAQRDISAL